MAVFKKNTLVGILMSDRTGITKEVKERKRKDFSQKI